MLRCDSCGKDFEAGVSYEWKAGKRVNTKVTSIEGNKTTYETTYTNLTSIPTGICSDCFSDIAESALKKHRKGALRSLLIGLALSLIPLGLLLFLNLADDAADCIGVLAMVGLAMFLYGLLALLLGRRRDPQKEADVRSVLRPFATAKMEKAERDTLWTREEYARLRIG